MPSVPRKGTRSVQGEQFPDAMLRPVAPIEAFGGGRPAARAEAAGMGVQEEFQKIQLEAKREADEIEVTRAMTEYENAITASLYDPQNGALTKQGQDAFGTPEWVGKDLAKAEEGIFKTLSSETQKQAVKQYVMRKNEDVNRQLQVHIAAETRRYDDEVTKAALESKDNEAMRNYMDPVRLDRIVEEKNRLVTLYALRSGKSAEWTKLAHEEAESGTYATAIRMMLSMGQDLAAKDYFEKIKDRLTKDDIMDLQSRLKEGSKLGEAQRLSDEAVAKGLDRPGAMRHIRENAKDPEVRALSERIADHEYMKMQQDRDEAENVVFSDLFTKMEANPGVPPEQLDPNGYTSLSPNMRVALQRSLQRNTKSDPHLLLEFLELVGSEPEKIASMTRATFYDKYWSHFDDSDRTRAENFWVGAKKEGKKYNPHELDIHRIFTVEMQRAKRWPTTGSANDAQVTQFADIEQKVFSAVRGEEELKGERLGEDDIRKKIVDVMNREIILADVDEDKIKYARMGAVVSGGTAVPLVVTDIQTKVKLVDLTRDHRIHYRVIPEDQKVRMRNAILYGGVGKPTEDRIERLYNANLRGADDEVRKILEEK